MSLKRFAVRCGLYTEEEINTDDYKRALKQGPADELNDFWAAISTGTDPFAHRKRGK
jgi:hypothetical protein